MVIFHKFTRGYLVSYPTKAWFMGLWLILAGDGINVLRPTTNLMPGSKYGGLKFAKKKVRNMTIPKCPDWFHHMKVAMNLKTGYFLGRLSRLSNKI